MDRWRSMPFSCKGGLEQSLTPLEFGTDMPGFARQLINFEPSVEGGYRRINGYAKYDSAVVPGDSNLPVTGVKVALGGVMAVRKTSTDNRIYFSSGSGWGVKLNASARTGAVTKSRFISYSISEPVVILTDGSNPAWKWNGTTETTINGTGAPTAPKYSAMHLSRLILAPASNTSSIALSAANNDTDFNGASGAIEINVGDTIKGLKTFRDTLYIFCQNNIFKLIGNSSNNFSVVPVARSIGCLSHDSIQEVGGEVFFLANDGIRPISATERIGDIELALLSRPIQPTLKDEVLGAFGEDSFSSCIIRKKSQYRLFVNNTNTTEASNINYLAKFTGSSAGNSIEWAFLQGFRPYCADSEYSGNNELAIFAHPTNGYVYRQDSGNDFDGTTINWLYATPFLTFGDSFIRKVIHKVDVFAEFEGSADITFGLKFDYEEASVLQPPVIALNSSGGFSAYGSSLYGTAVYSGNSSQRIKTNTIGAGFTVSYIFDGLGGNPFTIKNIDTSYAIKGRR